MPCPYFFPIAPRQETEWFRPPRAPLGSLHTGACHATPAHETVEAQCCNFGYARDVCPRFPADAEADAARYTHTPAGVLCVLEKAHRPLRHLPAEELTDPILRAQAEAFRRSDAVLSGE